MRRDDGRLLVFTLGPEADARRHPVLPASRRSDEVLLRAACLEAVVEGGIQQGFEVVLSAPEPLEVRGTVWRPQGAGPFGDRVTRAVAESFEETPGPLVLVGTDSPGLGASHLSEARRRLVEDPEAVVVGPAPDGGFYLLAAARPLGDVLDGIPWCSPRTREALLAALRRSGRPVHLLRPLRDLDRPSDAARLVRRRRVLPSVVAAAAERVRRALRELCQWRPAPSPGRSSLAAHDLSFGRAPPRLEAA